MRKSGVRVSAAALQTAAYNMAWVLTKIMVQGKIDPVDY